MGSLYRIRFSVLGAARCTTVQTTRVLLLSTHSPQVLELLMAGSSGPVRALGFGGGEFHETRSHEVRGRVGPLEPVRIDNRLPQRANLLLVQ